MKKLLLGLIALCGFGMSVALPNVTKQARAEDEPVIVERGTVVIETYEHGSITADKLEGDVGEFVTLTVSPSFLYVAEFVKVNDVTLIESEETSGLYTFALVAGENKVSAGFAVDKETLGVFSNMYKEATEKDWTNLFSTENVLTIVKWVMDGGILLAMVGYFIKDKKLAKTVESKIGSMMNELLPETSRQIIIDNMEKVISPIFSNLNSQMVDITKAMNTFAKCMALSQENTPESRKAIIDELTGLQLGDSNTLAEVKAYIEKTIKDALNAKDETLKAIEEIKEKNEKILEKEHSDGGVIDTYDGTSI